MQQKIKIKCPSGKIHGIEECINCPFCIEHLPAPILKSLLNGRTHQKKEQIKPTFGVGLLVSNCLRQSYYKLTEEQLLELEKLWFWSRGQALHSFITTSLEKEEKEIFVKKEFPYFDVIGFIDAMHENVIYEFKTTSSIPTSPQTPHVLQAQAYFSLLPEDIKNKIKNIKLVYLSLQNVKTFDIPMRDITPYLEARAVQLLKALENKTPPEKEVSWLCKHCEFYEKCFGQKIHFID
ncbi:MAG: Dna2/Cas4 domain-containing protein [Candidatus Nanoarchaeia archaeon]